MIRAIIISIVLVVICTPLLAIGFFLRGLGMVFIKPACWIGNNIVTWVEGGSVS